MTQLGTIAVDSGSELARLYFSKDMGKTSMDMDKIRAVNNYPGTTERLNMLVRRLKNFRDAGYEIVFTMHEDIQKVYARGGMVGAKGGPPPEPIAVKGWPDLPGNRTPDEFCRAADNVFHVRYISGKPTWVARRESLGGGTSDYWEVKNRFNAEAIQSGLLPADYTELKALAEKNPAVNWDPPYIWILYGAFGIGKTRSLLSFPKPLHVFDLDKGTTVYPRKDREKWKEDKTVTIYDDIDPEEGTDCAKFVAKLEALLP